MTRSRSLSAHSPNYSMRRAIGATLALMLALTATYGGFLGTCALMLVAGWSA